MNENVLKVCKFIKGKNTKNVHLLYMCLFSYYYIPGTLVSTEDKNLIKTDCLPSRTHSLRGDRNTQIISKQWVCIL